MTIIQSAMRFDEQELHEWAENYRLHDELEVETVKSLPEFQEWALTHVGPDQRTERGLIPGWTEQECARRWVDFNGFEFPAPPLSLPEWADPELTDISAVDRDTVVIRFEGKIEVDDGVAVDIHETFIIDGDPIRTQVSCHIEGFEETVIVMSNEITPLMSALSKLRETVVQ